MQRPSIIRTILGRRPELTLFFVYILKHFTFSLLKRLRLAMLVIPKGLPKSEHSASAKWVKDYRCGIMVNITAVKMVHPHRER